MLSGIFEPFSSSAQIGWAPFKTSFPITNEFLPIWIFPSESFLIRFPPDTEIPDWSIVVGFVVGPISKVFFVESPILAVVVDPDLVLIRPWRALISVSLLEMLEALEAISVSLLEILEALEEISESLLVMLKKLEVL